MGPAEQRITAALERITGDKSGAVVTLCEQAIDEARELDQQQQRGARLGPLAGVPFTVKDVITTAGTRTTAGCRPLADHVPSTDAPAVARLRRAGAVVVGKTNCSELALGAWTGNPLFPATRHPSLPGRSPGGSSGGCAAAVAAGLVTLSLGTDYGGSVRFPAACCGVVGLRPTPGRIDATGQIPRAPRDSPRARFSLIGPIGRHVEDVADAFRALNTTATMGSAGTVPRSVAITGDQPPLATVAELLRRSGIRLAEVDPVWLREAESTFTELRALDTFTDLRPIADQLGDDLRELIQTAPTTVDRRIRDRLEQRAADHRRQALEFLRNHHFLIAPIAHIQTPPPAGQPPDLEALGPCRAITLLGLPAVSINGVQIIGPPSQDEVTLALAKLIENASTVSKAPTPD